MKHSWLFSLLLLAGCEKGSEVKNNTPQDNQSLREFPEYNLKTVVTMKGQVIDLSGGMGPQDMIQILLRTEEGDIPVILGPSWFIEDGSVQIQPYDEMEVKGSKLYANGRVFIVASEIKMGDYRIKLRDDQGNPRWSSGWKKS